MESEKEKMLSGRLYNAADTELVRERAHARELLFQLNHTRPSEADKRKEILRRPIRSKGTFTIEPPFYCDYGYNIQVGDNFYANFGCVILDVNTVQIGRNVLLVPYVQIYTATHPTDPARRLTGLEFAKPIIIGDNVWIGGGAIICPGVKIGNDVTIGAGSVVAKDLPDGVIAAGNPCKVIRPARSHLTTSAGPPNRASRLLSIENQSILW
jgi:maltose O-acetyltransferase